MHPAGMPELPLPSINDRVAGLPFLPGTYRLTKFVVPFGPRKAIELLGHILARHVRVVKQQVVRELPPSDFLAEGFHVPFRGIRVERCQPSLPRTDLALREMGRQARGSIDRGNVTSFGIAVQCAGAELAQTLVCARFPGCPGFSHASAPVRSCRQERKLVNWYGTNVAPDAVEAFGCR